MHCVYVCTVYMCVYLFALGMYVHRFVYVCALGVRICVYCVYVCALSVYMCVLGVYVCICVY